MGTKARKSKGSKRRAAPGQSDAGKLRALIEGVIDAQHRGDPAQREAALEALGRFESRAGSPQLRQQAAEACAAARNDVSVDRVRLLGEIAARLG